jgi:hypothetical protein
MKKTWLGLFTLTLGLLWPIAGHSGTRVWGFYGWGPNGWSSGVDQIAQQARTIHGVEGVHVYDYRDTQRVANEISSSPPRTRIVVYGYSCGGNSATLIGTSFAGHRNINAVVTMQPSIWCGGTPHLTDNVAYGQNTFASCLQTLGLGCLQLSGARRLYQIERPEWHGQADTDPDYQADVLSAINTVANGGGCPPQAHRCHGHTVIVHRPLEGESRVIVLHHGQRP